MTKKSAIISTNNIPYIVAVIAMMLIGVAGIVAITIFKPGQDNTSVITMIIGFLAPTTLSLLAYMKAQETHASVNSRLDVFIASARKIALEEGKTAGRKEANDRTDALRKRRE